MRILRHALLLPVALLAASMLTAADAYTPLWLYSGSWQVTRPNQPPDKLTNQCAHVGRFFTCEQTVNGVPGNLLIFIPIAGKPGRYYTQNVRPDGLASSRADLEIQGDRWVFSSTWNQGGSTIYYRTTNTFSGKNKIAYEQAESSDNKKWSVKSSGEDTRIGAAPSH